MERALQDRLPRATVRFVPEKSEPDDRSMCTPCRGEGRLNSNAGGEPHPVICPWCEGTGIFVQEHDSQEAGERLREQPPPERGE